MAVGVIAAQSIGEPGTQLTMRTFHIGGTASRVSEASKHEATNAGIVHFLNVQTVTNKDGNEVAINRNGKLLIVDKQGREKERYALVYGSLLKVHDGQAVKEGEALVEWDPYTSAILTEVGGKVTFKDIVEGENVREETDKVTGLTQMVIVESARPRTRTDPHHQEQEGRGEEVSPPHGRTPCPSRAARKSTRATSSRRSLARR